jgi:hypothetical protein
MDILPADAQKHGDGGQMMQSQGELCERLHDFFLSCDQQGSGLCNLDAIMSIVSLPDDLCEWLRAHLSISDGKCSYHDLLACLFSSDMDVTDTDKGASMNMSSLYGLVQQLRLEIRLQRRELAQVRHDLVVTKEQMDKCQSKLAGSRDEMSRLASKLAGSTDEISKPEGGQHSHQDDTHCAESAAEKQRRREMLQQEVDEFLQKVRVEHKLEEIEGGTKYDSPMGLAECLLSGAVKLIKGSFLKQLYENGERIERRQELPPDAFWDSQEALQELSKRDETEGAKFLFALSYRWLSERHPDPERHHLTILAHVFTLALRKFGEIAVFWDFLSLPQKDDDGMRTRNEEIQFSAGLGASNIIYAQRLSCVLMQPIMPKYFCRYQFQHAQIERQVKHSRRSPSRDDCI